MSEICQACVSAYGSYLYKKHKFTTIDGWTPANYHRQYNHFYITGEVKTNGLTKLFGNKRAIKIVFTWDDIQKSNIRCHEHSINRINKALKGIFGTDNMLTVDP